LVSLFFTCGWKVEFDGTGVRFSIGEVFLVDFFIAIIVIGLCIAFPGAAVFFTSMGGLIFYAIVGWFSLSVSTSWSIFCFPAFPPVLLTAMLPTFFAQVLLPKCPALYSGLIEQANYNNSNCYVRSHRFFLKMRQYPSGY